MLQEKIVMNVIIVTSTPLEQGKVNHDAHTIFSTYSCSRSSWRRNDRIIGCLSPLSSLNGVRFLVPRFPFPPSSPSSTTICSVKTMSRSIIISLSSGALDCPKHKVDTTSMKKFVQLFLTLASSFFSSLLLHPIQGT